MSRYWTRLDSPVGPLRIRSDGTAVTAIEFSTDRVDSFDGERDDDRPVLAAARSQLSAYFAGTRTEFDLPLALRGTPFQVRVWDALRSIPYGTTTGYGAIANRLGLSMGCARAVGAANGANPVAIVVPCHRVIGSTGKLVGYAGGLDRKRRLLALEGLELF
jgi:methylated-DNA-[protein]-cysteine S-methyltransferase